MKDRISQFIDELNENIPKNLLSIEYQFNTEYDFIDFDPLRDEISKCLICNLCQASITLTNHLLEGFLKTILIYNDTLLHWNDVINKDFTLLYKMNSDKYDKIMLNKSLQLAKDSGLITEDQWKELDEFRRNFRNAYSHAEKKKIFKDKTIGVNFIKFKDNQPNVSESNQILLTNLPFGQGFAQVIISQNTARDYFVSVDRIIRDVINRFKNKLNIR